MDIVRPGDPDYHTDRQISNARFDLKPASIYYCEDWKGVAKALTDARDKNLHFRVRSGGHQHEGMCSGNDVLLIDVSRIEHIKPSPDNETAWIGPGAKLQNVYGAMFGAHRLIPGGGCGDVRIGGLVQGGGWGPYSRKLGLTCDRLISFKMVTADETLLDVTVGDQQYDELFWAVRGAGGGNFGVITDLQFSLARNEGQIWQFTAKWEDWKDVQSVVELWMNTFPSDTDWNLTTFCRLSANGEPKDPPLVISGNYLGTQAELEQTLRRLLKDKYPVDPTKISYSPVNAIGKLINLEYQPGPSLSDTCAGNPFRHKVSSCFPTSTFGPNAVGRIVEYLKTSPFETNARRYLSLHSMGGFINSDDNLYKSRSCFPYRAKPFMLQYQAWWQPLLGETDPDSRYLKWVDTFRDQMKKAGYTEGSFINFPDRDLGLPEYYAGNFPKLRQVKRAYDPKNRFKFEMSIPLP
jgi:FAD/FMN-containing dehydrogenase